jgi:transcriptional/translational regulatory protein YebC/TACO1
LTTVVTLDKAEEDAIELGAEEVEEDEENLTFFCPSNDFVTVKDGLSAKQYDILNSGVHYVPNVFVEVEGKDLFLVTRLIESLEDHENVIGVHHNVA